RLRPDGGKSLLVASLPAFVAYQRERAWTWEQQALVRARAVAGDVALGTEFARERGEVLRTPRNPVQVIADVRRMRSEWRKQRDRSDAATLDLKQGAGALLDIQFLLQGLVLLQAHVHPGLAARGDTPHLLAACAEAGALAAGDVDALAIAHSELLWRAARGSTSARPDALLWRSGFAYARTDLHWVAHTTCGKRDGASGARVTEKLRRARSHPRAQLGRDGLRLPQWRHRAACLSCLGEQTALAQRVMEARDLFRQRRGACGVYRHAHGAGFGQHVHRVGRDHDVVGPAQQTRIGIRPFAVPESARDLRDRVAELFRECRRGASRSGRQHTACFRN